MWLALICLLVGVKAETQAEQASMQASAPRPSRRVDTACSSSAAITFFSPENGEKAFKSKQALL